MLSTVGYFLSRFIVVILAINCLIFVLNWKKLYDVLRFFGYYLLFNLTIEISSRILYEILKVNNLPLLHLYTLGEFILLSIFYYQITKSSDNKKVFFMIFTSLIAILIILNSIFLQSIYGFNSYAKAPVQFIIIGYSLFYFFATNLIDAKKNIKEKSRLIVNSAILIYYSGSLFIFMFSDYFLRNAADGEGLPNGFWLFNVILLIIFQLIIFTAIWKVLRNKKSTSLL